jgi:hypothetical protein
MGDDDKHVNGVRLNTVDDVTLAFMVNTVQYEKYLKKNHLDFDFDFKRDIRFYRKRIISLTKDLFKNQNEIDKKQNADVTMVGAFNMYMRACISYLKFSDQSETIQKCYVCLGITDDDVQINENIKIQKCICKNKNEDDLFELNKANKLCLKPKEVKKITLDNYVIRKNVKKSEPIIYPQQLTFNPRDPAFKYKGLKPKPISRSQSVEKIRIESDADNVNKLDDDNLKKVTTIESGENGEKKTNEKTNEKKKMKKNKNVSFDVTNYIDNI